MRRVQLETEVMMPMLPHLDELSEKHRNLEQKIEEALSHPSMDPVVVSKLKREKLKLKDKISKLQVTAVQ
jgi:hypothetical protein